MEIPFSTRRAGGRALAQRLLDAGLSDGLVLGLPSGGMDVAAGVADALGLELDLLLLRALPVPGFVDLAMGAVATGGGLVFNPDVLHQLRIYDEVLETVVEQEQQLLQQDERRYRRGRPTSPVAGRRVVLVEEGLDDPARLRIAVETLRQRRAAEIWVASPVADPGVVARLEGVADRVEVLLQTRNCLPLSRWYRELPAVDEEDVQGLLLERAEAPGAPAGLLLDVGRTTASRVPQA